MTSVPTTHKMTLMAGDKGAAGVSRRHSANERWGPNSACSSESKSWCFLALIDCSWVRW